MTGINAFSRGRDGTTAAAGWAESYDGKTAAFIEVFPADGQPPKIIRTNPYAVEKLAVAVDGTVWTVGNVLKWRPEPADTDSSSGTIRHFDQSGKLLESFCPFSTLNDKVWVMMGFLAASRDRVGWISTGDPHAAEGRLGAYAEFTAGGKVDQYPLPPMAPQPGAALYGLALTDDGSVFATVLVSSHKEQMFALKDLPSGAQFLLGGSSNTIATWAMYTKDVRF